ncbi:hypothetical protein VNI00_002670 [Paramarasmius palmivorus]|uniref:Uncharacterized protein n=1 Tax=Paramarasmius palmivorus TaxID=297713 RepID=A0AAW0DYX8_9AGAR
MRLKRDMKSLGIANPQNSEEDVARLTRKRRSKPSRQKASAKKQLLGEGEFHDKAAYEQKVQGLETELQAERQRVKKLSKELNKREIDIKRLQTDHNEEKRYCAALLSQLGALQRDYSIARLHHQQRARELHAAHKFLHEDTNQSVEGTVSLLDRLNAEIHHVSASISLLDYNDIQDTSQRSLAEEDELDKDVVWMFGETMSRVLRKSRGSQHAPFILQCFLQGVASRHCYYLIEQWAPDFEISQMLCETYNRMKTSNLPLVVERWKALTKAQTKYPTQTHTALIADIRISLLEMIRKVLHTTGRRNWQTYSSYVEKCAENVLNLASRLDTLLGKDVSNPTLKVFCAIGGDSFAEGTMEDTCFPENKTHVGDVVGSTDLGLCVQDGGPVLRKARVLRLSSVIRVVE